MMCLRWVFLLTLGVLSAGFSTATDCEEAAGSGPTIGLDATGPSVTVDVACHFTSATSSETYMVSSTDSYMVAARLKGTLLTLNPGHVGSATPGVATVTVSRGVESYVINVNVSSCVTAAGGALLPGLVVNPDQEMTLDMSNYFAKTGGGALTYEASSSNTDTVSVELSDSQLTLRGGTLPEGVDQAYAELTLTARSGCGAAYLLIPVTVMQGVVNERPTIVSPLGAVRLASHGYMAKIALSKHFSDPDDIRYSVESSDPATVAGSIDNDTLTVTTGPVTATATDSIFVTATELGGLSTGDTLVVTVTPNVRPSVDKRIPDMTLAAGGTMATYTLSEHFSDPDGNSADLTYVAETSEPDTVTAAIAGGVLTVTTEEVDEPGKSTITVTATDPGGLSNSDEFVVSVSVSNRPPTCNDITVTLATNDDDEKLDMDSYCTDPDGDDLTYALTEAPTGSAASITLSNDSLTIAPASVGTATATVTASDGNGGEATSTVSVKVSNANRPPICNDITVTLTVRDEDKELEMDSYCTDQDDDDLTYALTEGPTGSAASITLSDGDLTIAPTAVGTATATVTASDGNGGEAISEVRVTVQNLPPETEGSINDIAVQQNDDDEEFSVVSYFSDPENAVLTYTANSSASGVVTASMGEDEDAGTLTLSDYSAGTSTITVTATDPHQAAARQAFSFAVCGNPTASTIPHQALLLGTDAEIDLDDYFSDPHGGDLSYTTTRTGVLVTLELSDDNTLTIESEVVGSATVSVTATNECGSSSDPQPIGVTVRGVPVAQGTIQDRTLTVNGSALSFDVASYFSEPDGDELKYSVSVGLPVRPRIPDIVSASMSGSTLTLTPLSTQGRVIVKVTATDSDGSASQSFAVTVSGGS